MHVTCLEQHLGNIRHSINVAMITLRRKTFEFSKTLKFFYIFMDKMELCKLGCGIGSE